MTCPWGSRGRACGMGIGAPEGTSVFSLGSRSSDERA